MLQSFTCSKYPISYTSEETLALLINEDLSKEAYQDIKKLAKAKFADIYRAYNKLREKKLCYPENFTIRKMSAEVTLQNPRNYTTMRLLFALENFFGENQELAHLQIWDGWRHRPKRLQAVI